MAATVSMKASLALRPTVKVQSRQTARHVARTRLVTKAIADTSLVIGGSTVAALALGRFVFLPFHQRSLEKAGLGTQNGLTHYEAGDNLAQEATWATKTTDPAGFTLAQVLAWGALGHAVGYYILATSSLGVPRLPF